MSEQTNDQQVEKAQSILQDGCYYIRYIPQDPSSDPDVLFYEGTVRMLRLDSHGERSARGELAAGGDLYCRRRNYPYGFGAASSSLPISFIDPALLPNPANGIPIFPRQEYRYYLEILKISEGWTDESFTAKFRINRFERDASRWPMPGVRTILMKKTAPPVAVRYPDAGNKAPLYFTGSMLDEES